jgi:esterase/lipase
MKLQIQPLVALCDEKLSISVSELPPFARVKLSAAMCFPWAPSVRFASFAWFTADAAGQVDLSRQKPDSGSYDFIDSMGLIVSLKCQDPHGLAKIGQNISVRESLFIDMVAECGGEKATAKLERRFMAPEIRVQNIRDEFVGDLFYAEGADRPTIVWLGGSGSGLGVNQIIAAPLASHGFNVLSLPYFGEKGLPPRLSEVPLEYLERVFAWLSKNPLTAGKEIRVFGMSKGGELALVLASRYHFIRKAALFSPHAYCFQGIAYKNVSSWTYGRKPLPFIRLKNRWVLAHLLRCFINAEPFGFTPTFQKGLALAQNRDTARIKVEEAQADLLLFATGQNGMWNSRDGCVEIMETLRKYNYPHHHELIVYEDAGEPTPPPYVIPPGESSVKMAPRLVLSLGGTLEGNARAQADAWEKAIEFFEK